MIALLPALLFAQAIHGPVPDQRLTPDQVVRIVAEALGHNNSPIPNAGIFTTYRFASPANRALTGPYGRFLRMVRTASFAPMLTDGHAAFGPITQNGGHAWQTMRISGANGRAIEYRWDLSLQRGGTLSGCWMVDGVSRF